MKSNIGGSFSSQKGGHQAPWFLIIACLVVLIVGIVLKFRRHDETSVHTAQSLSHSNASRASSTRATQQSLHTAPSTSKLPPEEIVAGKVIQFARNRRAIAEAMLQRAGKEMPDEIKRFFDAAEAGHWEKLDALFKSLMSARSTDNPLSAALNIIGPAVNETYGTAESAHKWSAQKLLDYGNAVLSSLRPDMVYIGGTDAGRYIPTLLNETSEGAHHIILTQNALADGTYRDYLDFQYHDQLAMLSPEESEQGFRDYHSDAQRRFQHDQQFPNEPKQVRPGEDTKMEENRFQVSGQSAVMTVNEKLLQTLLQKNPDLSFALEESMPLTSTYADASPLGPLMELRTQDAQTAFTPERAAQTLDYWNTVSQRLLTDPEASNSHDTMQAYSHDVMAQANLLAAHDYGAQAEQAYHLASQLSPDNPEPVSALSDFLQQKGRNEEARQVIEDFMRNHPDARPAMEKLRGSGTLSKAN